MSSEACQKTEKNSEFTVTTITFPCLSVTVSPCLRWVPVAEVLDNTLIVFHENKRNRLKSFFARIKHQSDILVGKLAVWQNGAIYESNEDIEVLQVMPNCSVTWMPYTPGDPIPHYAVIGGRLGDPYSGTPIINGVTRRGDRRCGYYNPETQLGYIIYVTRTTTTRMDILVFRERWVWR